ncbi:MAG TPA: energy transducer TonB [Bryobacteraceae bacterium]|nr:energy transducer TonB [Bryobacteraceae bacterium]
MATGTQKAMEAVQEDVIRLPDAAAQVTLTAGPARAVSAPRRLSPWFLSPAVFLLAAGATFLLLFFRTSSVTASTPQAGALLEPRSSLDLRVQTEGPGLLLSWNRYSRAVQSARTAVLDIQDGSQHREIALDQNQMATGSVFYRPASDDVAFRLDLRDARGSEVSQILRVLDSSPRKRVGEGTHPDSNVSTAKARETLRKPLAGRQNAPASVRTVSVASAIPAPPEAVAAGPAVDPVTSLLQPTLAPPPATLQPAAPVPSARPKDMPAYVPPRPVKWVQPDVQIAEPLDVKVKIRIDETGHVTAAHALLEGPRRDRKLMAAAAAAVRQWTFEPAKAHGANVPCEETIVIHLGPEAQ